jgi:acetyltransferase-like isoleucine patch superfamily enzyme
LNLLKNILLKGLIPSMIGKIAESIELPLQKIQVKSLSKQDLNEKNSRRLVAIGAGRGLSQLFEILTVSQKSWEFIGSYDDFLWSKRSLPIKGPILGPVDADLIIQDFNNNLFDAVVITVSTSIPFRKSIYQDLIQKNIHLPNFIHPSCVVDATADLGQGNMVMPFVHIGPSAQLGENNFISAYCNIEHHVNIGGHNTFGPSVVLSGGVNIGNENKFGTGIFIEPFVSIGNSCLLASGIILTKDVKNNSVVRNFSNLQIKSRDD